jgi:magnesium transporter
MLYLSQLLNAPILDQQDERVGRIIDVLALTTQVGQDDPAYPVALLVEVEDNQLRRIPPAALEHKDNSWYLNAPIERFPLQSASINDDEVRLAQDVLDKQIIDLVRKKAVRVNDLCLSDDWQILGIDKSSLGLVRRLAPFWLANAINDPTSANHTLVLWKDVELIHSPQHREDQTDSSLPNQVAKPKRILSGHLGELHPADIASIVHQVTVEEGTRLIERLDNKTAADTMEEIDTERQAQILENLAPERAASILQEMGPDEIADLLAQLPEDRKQELLRQMKPDESEDVQVLLEYEADSAGGLMTTDYIVLNQTRTVQEALEAVRLNIITNDVRIAYVYCVEDETQDENHPLGVVSIWDMLIAQPTQTIQEIMEADIISVQPDTDPRAVAETLAKYNLLAVPVINEDGFMEGVVTVDDALDVLLPKDHRRKTTRMY